MESTENLSNSDIRLKLSELGFPCGPVTATTRKYLLKKLKSLLEQTQSTSGGRRTEKGKARPSLSRFSSGGEESEDDSKKKRNNSMPPPKSPSRSTSRRLPRSALNSSITSDFGINDSSTSVTPEFKPSISPKISPSTAFENNSRRPTDNQNSVFSHNMYLESAVNAAVTKSRSSGVGIPALDPRRYFHNISNPDEFETGSDSDAIESDIPRLSRVNSGISYSTAEGLRSGASFSPILQSSLSNQPYSSEFTRRLSAGSRLSHFGGSSTSVSGLSSNLLDLKESDDEENNTVPRYSRFSTGAKKRGPILGIGQWMNSTTVSMILVLILALFFAALTVSYINVRHKDMPITTDDTVFPVCNMGGKAGVNCIPEGEMQTAMHLFRQVYEVLHERAVKVHCGHTTDSSILNNQQIADVLLQKDITMTVWDADKKIDNIKVLVKANPQWGVTASDYSMDLPRPNLPFMCSLLNITYSVIDYFIRIALGLLLLCALWYGVVWWLDRTDQHKKEVFRLVENIVQVLSMHHQDSGGSFLAINHVRDQLIPPAMKNKLSRVWDAAVNYIDEKESRVRTEVQQVAGEEFRVWRWLPSPCNNSGREKVWQGQAFKTMEGSPNSLPVSPTPCLKLRHMFDPITEEGEEWMTRVKDAILEKCDGVKVVHMAVDRGNTEGTVYIKCASCYEAGRAYKLLHGSWFDSKLVTVKFLRVERYHQRFPDATHSITALRPSNDHKLSLK